MDNPLFLYNFNTYLSRYAHRFATSKIFFSKKYLTNFKKSCYYRIFAF